MKKFEWVKSGSCPNNATCVEVMEMNNAVWVRDGRTHSVLRFTMEEWAAFLEGVRNGDFDHTEAGG